MWSKLIIKTFSIILLTNICTTHDYSAPDTFPQDQLAQDPFPQEQLAEKYPSVEQGSPVDLFATSGENSASLITTLAKKNGNEKHKDVGVVPAKLGQAPWQVSVVSSGWFGGTHFCGGALIGKKTVLTAAQCCEGSSALQLKVKYGGLDRNKLKFSTGISKVTMHPLYSSSARDNDYCVLTLADEMLPDKNVKIIKIADSVTASGKRAQLTGWGANQEKSSMTNSTMTNSLQYVEMDILSATECNKKWIKLRGVTINMICAKNKAASGCSGDTGGPLVVNGKLVGVSSWGAQGCQSDTTVKPRVFADPTEKTNKFWIESYIK